jgi:hypothetical protein
MIRRPRDTVESRSRLEAHRAATAANPLSEADIAGWLRSLGTLDDAVGKAEQLAICKELLAHAPDDDMLDSDARIIKMAIEELERELSNAPPPTPAVRRRRARLGDRRVRPADPDSDDTDPDDSDDTVLD